VNAENRCKDSKKKIGQKQKLSISVDLNKFLFFFAQIAVKSYKPAIIKQ
jgi:hypothetical protein